MFLARSYPGFSTFFKVGQIFYDFNTRNWTWIIILVKPDDIRISKMNSCYASDWVSRKFCGSKYLNLLTVDLLILARYRDRTVTIPWPYRDHSVTVPWLFYGRLFYTVYRPRINVPDRPPFTGQRGPPSTVQRPPSTVQLPPFSVHRSSFIFHRSRFTVHR